MATMDHAEFLSVLEEIEKQREIKVQRKPEMTGTEPVIKPGTKPPTDHDLSGVKTERNTMAVTNSREETMASKIYKLRTEEEDLDVVPGQEDFRYKYLLGDEKTPRKKVITTCFFIPEKPTWNDKIPNYLLNLIKNIEIYRHDRKRLPEGFLYRVYIDKYLLKSVSLDGEKRVFFGLKKKRVLKYDIEDIIKTTPKTTPEDYQKDMKKNLSNYKSFFKLFNDYMDYISDNEEEYGVFLELIAFDCKTVKSDKVHDKDLPGHPLTFSSISRFLVFYDENVDIAFTVNSSCIVNIESRDVINSFVSSENKNYFFVYFIKGRDNKLYADLEKFGFEKLYDSNPLERKKIQDRSIAAGFFGYKKGSIFIDEIKSKINYLFTTYRSLENKTLGQSIFRYGIDEVILIQAINPILKDKSLDFKEGSIIKSKFTLDLTNPEIHNYLNYAYNDETKTFIILQGGMYEGGGQLRILIDEVLGIQSYEEAIYSKGKPNLEKILEIRSKEMTLSGLNPLVKKFGVGEIVYTDLENNLFTYFNTNQKTLSDLFQVTMCFDELKKLYLVSNINSLKEEESLLPRGILYFNLNSVSLEKILKYFIPDDISIFRSHKVQEKIISYTGQDTTPFKSADGSYHKIFKLKDESDYKNQIYSFLRIFNSEFDNPRTYDTDIYQTFTKDKSPLESHAGGGIKSRRKNKKKNRKNKTKRKKSIRRKRV